MESIPEALDHYLTFYEEQTMAKWGPPLKEKGIEEITYTDAEIASFRQSADGIAKAWVEENAGRGLPAQELFDMVTKMIAEKKG